MRRGREPQSSWHPPESRGESPTVRWTEGCFPGPAGRPPRRRSISRDREILATGALLTRMSEYILEVVSVPSHWLCSQKPPFLWEASFPISGWPRKRMSKSVLFWTRVSAFPRSSRATPLHHLLRFQSALLASPPCPSESPLFKEDHVVSKNSSIQRNLRWQMVQVPHTTKNNRWLSLPDEFLYIYLLKYLSNCGKSHIVESIWF